MRVVIIGAGRVGFRLAARLTAENHDVSLIEKDESRAREISPRVDCLILKKDGASLAALEEAGLAKADALVCVTGADEQNLIICAIASSRYKDVLKIARVRNEDYANLKISGSGAALHMVSEQKNFLGVKHFIHPDIEAARAVLRAIDYGAAGETLSFGNSGFVLCSLEVTPNSVMDGLPLNRWRKNDTGESLVALLERDGESIPPGGGSVLQRGDRVHVLCSQHDADKIFKASGAGEKIIRSIGIAGASKIGVLIASGLIHGNASAPNSHRSAFSVFKSFIKRSGRRVVLIEKNYEKCREFSARHPDALVFNQDITDENFVAEESIGALDLIVMATDKQDLNIISALYLKSQGVKRAAALVSTEAYAVIARRLGVDVVIPTTAAVTDAILSRIIGKSVKGVHTVGDGSVEIYEIKVRKDAAIKNLPITGLRLSCGALVLLVSRDGTSFIPKGDYIFMEGDEVIIIAKAQSMELESFFGNSKDSG
ncbi:MAG: NAD-binding protein [Spirochaetaceae bacterium]|jgi:trk system potassium uptake protein TrkA|nr:NAD-binding protein [Spirochaetaceae bacterium]